MAAGSNICCLLSVNLLQDNDDLSALHFVPKSRVANGAALTAVICKMHLQRGVQKYELSSSLPTAAGSEETEEIQIYNWRAEEG